jgi:RNA 3'-terminal phosphate cyclase (ATP)
MIEIDGSQGEGGGQVLRSSLSLSLMTGKPMRITNIRARRPKPGLRAQHLKSVDAAVAVGKAEIEGASFGSQSLTFSPRGITAGQYQFDIGTAGSTSLVLQTIFVPLGLADHTSRITIIGGTHVKWSPAFHYLRMNWLPHMHQIGFRGDLTLDLAGFFPQGGGRIRAQILPSGSRTPLCLTDRGDLQRIEGLSAVSNLPESIAIRQRRQALRRLSGLGCPMEIDVIQLPSKRKGTMIILKAVLEKSQACYVGLGERGKPAEKVADEAAEALLAFMVTDGAIDEYLADQLLVPLTFALGNSEIRTSKVTQHLITNAEVIQAFTSTEIKILGELGEPGLIQIRPSI